MFRILWNLASKTLLSTFFNDLEYQNLAFQPTEEIQKLKLLHDSVVSWKAFPLFYPKTKR